MVAGRREDVCAYLDVAQEVLAEPVVITTVDDRQVVVGGVPSAVGDPLAAGEESASVAGTATQFGNLDRRCRRNRKQVSIFDIHASVT